MDDSHIKSIRQRYTKGGFRELPSSNTESSPASPIISDRKPTYQRIAENRSFWVDRTSKLKQFRKTEYIGEKMTLYNKAFTKDIALLNMIPKSMANPKFIKPYISGRRAQIRRQMNNHLDYMNLLDWKQTTLKD